MAFALGRLGWSPDAFWRSTPREIAAAVTRLAPRADRAPGRAALEGLIARFPDA